MTAAVRVRVFPGPLADAVISGRCGPVEVRIGPATPGRWHVAIVRPRRSLLVPGLTSEGVARALRDEGVDVAAAEAWSIEPAAPFAEPRELLRGRAA